MMRVPRRWDGGSPAGPRLSAGAGGRSPMPRPVGGQTIRAPVSGYGCGEAGLRYPARLVDRPAKRRAAVGDGRTGRLSCPAPVIGHGHRARAQTPCSSFPPLGRVRPLRGCTYCCQTIRVSHESGPAMIRGREDPSLVAQACGPTFVFLPSRLGARRRPHAPALQVTAKGQISSRASDPSRPSGRLPRPLACLWIFSSACYAEWCGGGPHLVPPPHRPAAWRRAGNAGLSRTRSGTAGAALLGALLISNCQEKRLARGAGQQEGCEVGGNPATVREHEYTSRGNRFCPYCL
jgi:hypothetical protein